VKLNNSGRGKTIVTPEEYAFGRLLSYVRYQWPEYIIGKHHAYIAKCLEEVEKGNIDRLIITMPPRHGKTYLASEFFSAWYLGRNPANQVIFASYSHDRASDVGRKVRNQLLSPQFQSVFPDCRVSKDTQSVSNVGTDEGGHFFAVGLGGAITGRGAHCFTGETLIDTEIGKISIRTLYLMNNPPKVLSYNHENGKIALSKIIAKRMINANEIFRIETFSGNKIECTRDHGIYSFESGYRKAGLLRSGDKVAVQKKQIKYNMQNMCDSPQIKADTISTVTRICTKGEHVYDIQVEENENFFANNILSHNCLLIDDPIKGQEEANSDLFMIKMRDWYQSTAYTRLMSGNSAIVIIQTRWVNDDLVGWLLKEHEDEGWAVINFPAMAVEEDILGRNVGDALWPEMYDEERLTRIKKAVGIQTWNALYQGNPVGQEGSIVKYEWLQYYEKQPEDFKQITQSWDTAFKANQLNDPSVCITFGETDSGYYVLDVFRKRLEYPDLRKAAIAMFNEWKPNRVIVEDRASGQSLIQDLNRGTNIPVIPIKAETDKITRLSSVTGIMEAGKFWVPTRAPWLNDYVTELTSVPYAKHDDMADATSQYLRYSQKPKYKPGRNARHWK